MRYLQLEKYVFEFGVFKAANVDNLIPGEQINNNTTQSKKYLWFPIALPQLTVKRLNQDL